MIKTVSLTEQADFHHMPFGEAHFDKAYAIEAMTYSPSLHSAYSEVFRVLKPGGLFAVYELVTTDNYNPGDPYHRQIRTDICVSKYDASISLYFRGFTSIKNCWSSRSSAMPIHALEVYAV